jgi:hypothetical protein
MHSSIIIAALCVATISATSQTMVFVTNGQPYKILVTWDSAQVSDATVTSLAQAFFYTYPKMVSKYNPSALQNITWNFDPTYSGVAATSAGVTRFSTAYFGSRSDSGVAVHESMHIVQAYRKSL